MPTHTYCFILGNNHSLSKVEILQVLATKKITFSILEASQEVLVIESNSEITSINCDSFGGVVKIVEVVVNIPTDTLVNRPTGFESAFELPMFIPETATDRIPFGISVYNAGGTQKEIDDLWHTALSLNPRIKNICIQYGYSSSFLPLRDRKLSSVVVDKTKLLTKGFELCLCVGAKTTYMGKTISIQNYESYSYRDYGRPERDVKSGMIPPKLAKIMINLAGKDTTSTLLDPFCGSGTILEEMILFGYKNIIGSDHGEKAVADTEKNLDWLFEHYKNIERKSFNINLHQCDVKKISEVIPEKSIHAIVTEPFLGSEKARYFSAPQLSAQIDELDALYLATFGEFEKILAPQGKVVFIFPIFKIRNRYSHIGILELLKQKGWKQERYLPQEFDTDKYRSLLGLELTERNSIVYYRPDQTVSREIMIFSKE